MATLMEIGEAIQSIESKKQSLKQAYEDLQKQSHFLSSFSLSWPEIESHFSNIQSSLQSRFSLLEQKEQSLPKSEQNPENPVPQNPQNATINAICEKMEAQKLRKLVKENCDSKAGFLDELGQALKLAPDPFKLVLDATQGFQPRGKITLILFEGLMMIEGVSVSEEMRERAKNFALEWKGVVNKEEKYPFEVVGLLSLLGCFGLVDDFGKDDALDLVYVGVKNTRVMNLCRVLGLEDKVPDLVQKFIENGRQLVAIKFVYEFKLTERFQPVELLKSYLKNAKKVAQKIRKKGKNKPKALGEGDTKEYNALKTVLKYVQDYKLESEYPPETLEKRVKLLEELKANRKNTVSNQSPKPTQPKKKNKVVTRQQLQNRNMRPVAYASSGFAAAPGIATGPPPQHYLQPPGLPVALPGHGPSSVASYAIPGSVPNDPFGLVGSLISYANNLGSSSSYQGPSSLDAYGFPPQHHPSYHPQ